MPWGIAEKENTALAIVPVRMVSECKGNAFAAPPFPKALPSDSKSRRGRNNDQGRTYRIA